MRFVDVDADAATFDSSRSTLQLPAGATVLFAGLYWGGKSVAGEGTGATPPPNPAALNSILFATPGGAYQPITGAVLGTTTDGGANYHAFANVTSTVQAAGAGVYSAANIQTGRGGNAWGGWSLVVAYRDPAAPFRNLSVFDGYQFVSASNASVSIPVSGFVTPPSGPVRTRLGVVAYDGDKGSPGSVFLGDVLRLNGTVVSDALNPANDFFNSSLTVAGTRRTANEPDYANTLGFDGDVVAVDGIIPNGATAATIALTTGGEAYYPGVVTTAIDLFSPTITTAKTVRDVNGGEVLPGDELEYDISLTNTGLDAAANVVLTDAIPAGTTYEPGSLSITAGPGTGALTDPAGDDRGEAGAGGATWRLGTGGTATAGGSLAIGATTSARFRVRVNAGTPAGTVIPNTATTSFSGATTGTPYTDTSAPAQVTVGGAPVIAARKTATLAVDADRDGGISAGDTLRYEIAVTNSGTQAATGVVVADTPDPATSLVTGSVTTTAGTVTSGNAPGDTTVRAAVGTLAPGASATVAFQARILATLPVGTTSIRNQATVTADGLPPVQTDDPLTVTVGDATVVPVQPAAPGGSATGGDRTRLRITATGPAVRRPGTRATYCFRVVNRGAVAARTTRITAPVPSGSVLVTRPAGSRLSAGSVTWNAGTLAPRAGVTRCMTLRLLGTPGQVRRPSASAVAANAARVSDAARTRLVGPRTPRPLPAVTG